MPEDMNKVSVSRDTLQRACNFLLGFINLLGSDAWTQYKRDNIAEVVEDLKKAEKT